MNIREFARTIGVSPTTVSHAISGEGRLSDATRRMVREVYPGISMTTKGGIPVAIYSLFVVVALACLPSALGGPNARQGVARQGIPASMVQHILVDQGDGLGLTRRIPRGHFQTPTGQTWFPDEVAIDRDMTTGGHPHVPAVPGTATLVIRKLFTADGAHIYEFVVAAADSVESARAILDAERTSASAATYHSSLTRAPLGDDCWSSVDRVAPAQLFRVGSVFVRVLGMLAGPGAAGGAPQPSPDQVDRLCRIMEYRASRSRAQRGRPSILIQFGAGAPGRGSVRAGVSGDALLAPLGAALAPAGVAVSRSRRSGSVVLRLGARSLEITMGSGEAVRSGRLMKLRRPIILDRGEPVGDIRELAAILGLRCVSHVDAGSVALAPCLPAPALAPVAANPLSVSSQTLQLGACLEMARAMVLRQASRR